jgi:DnaK suppressor protein
VTRTYVAARWWSTSAGAPHLRGSRRPWLSGSIGDMERARRRLVAERDQTLERLAGLTHDFETMVAASLDTNADDEHDPEGTTIAFERSQVGALVEQARQHLAEIDAALARLDAGTYGVCGECGRPIGEGRLEARPSARTCIRCAAPGRRR